MLPTTHPAEVIRIDPEGLEIANTYLQTQSIKEVAEALDVSVDYVSTQLNRSDIKSYIDSVFKDMGFNNRFKMRKAMDALISKKFQEMDEAGVGSSKDIVDLLALSHKMAMDQLDREIELEKVRHSSIKTQTNIQINDGGGTNYGSLLEKLMKPNA